MATMMTSTCPIQGSRPNSFSARQTSSPCTVAKPLLPQPASRSNALSKPPLQQMQSRRRLTGALCATAEAPTQSAAATSKPQARWYACVANAEFMVHDVQNEAFAEQLRERRRFFGEKGMELDFWLVSEPAWLDAKFPDKAKLVRRPCVALVSTDKVWIDFMKLRLDRVLKLDLGEMPQEEALKATAPIPDFEPFPQDAWTAPYSPYAPGWWKVFES